MVAEILHAKRSSTRITIKNVAPTIERLHFLTWLKSLHFGLSTYLDQSSTKLKFGLSMYLYHTFARKTFAQRIGSAEYVKSKSEVTHSVVLGAKLDG